MLFYIAFYEYVLIIIELIVDWQSISFIEVLKASLISLFGLVFNGNISTLDNKL